MKKTKRTKRSFQKKPSRSKPQRRIVKHGEYALVSLEIQQHQQLMRPDSLLVRAIIYLFGLYAALHHIRLHAVCVLNSRIQYVLYDESRDRVRFREDLHRSLAWVINAFRGRRGAVFCKPRDWPLHGPVAVADAIARTIAAPVAAGLVERSRDWPGLRTSVSDMNGVVRKAKRTSIYFGPNSSLPAHSELSVHLPELLTRHVGRRRAIADLKRRVKKAEAIGVREVEENGWNVLGADTCLVVDALDRARTTTSRLTRMTLEFSAGNDPNTLKILLAQRATFHAEYDRCRERMLAGEQHIVWPYGTYAMVENSNQAMAGPPPPLILAA